MNKDTQDNNIVEVFNFEIDPTIVNQNVKQYTADGIARFGEFDNQFDKYIDLYLGSTTNNAIINGASQLIYAGGIDLELLPADDLRRITKDFYLFGNATIQIVKGEMFHIPTNFVRAEEVDENGHINNFYFSTDWADPMIQPIEIPNWEYNKKAPRSIYYLRPYTPKAFYYNLPSYIGGLEYAEIEIELSTFHLNNIQNGFSGTKIININNGVPDANTRKKITAEFKDKLTGTKGDKVIIAFNKNKEASTTIEDVTIDNASEQFTALSEEAQNKVIIGHQVTSPLLLGIRTANGFSSNSDEMTEANKLYHQRVIKPAQDFILDSLEKITGQRARFIPIPVEVEVEDEQELESIKFDAATNIHLKSFIKMGSKKIKGYTLVDSAPVEFKNNKGGQPTKTKMSMIDNIVEYVSTGTAKPNQESEQDSEDIIIRYRYTGASNGERHFCNAMLRADKLYRIEDIEAMENIPVNTGFGLGGAATYSILLYKGGVNCKHQWFREIYQREGTDINTNQLDTISTSEARRRGYKVPTNDTRVSIRPNNMPNGGAA